MSSPASPARRGLGTKARIVLRASVTLGSALAIFGVPVAAQQHDHGHGGLGGHAAHAAAASTAAPSAPSARADSATPMTDAEIRRIDRDAGKVTLRHGAIANLDMPPMTMVFVARDKTWLDGLKVGDKVRFRAVEEQGSYVLTVIERVR